MPKFRKKPVVIDAVLASEVLDGASENRFSENHPNRIELWLVYFVAKGAWSAIAGVALFLAYPLWRRWWRS